nr:hypothetical protein [Bacteroidota bacterium]
MFKLDTSGFSNYTTTDFNNATDGTFQKIIFNNKGDKMVLINYNGFMAEYDFDRCTGIFGNEKLIFPEQSTNIDRWFWEGLTRQMIVCFMQQNCGMYFQKTLHVYCNLIYLPQIFLQVAILYMNNVILIYLALA